MTTIVVLDGYTLNPGDLNWENFKELGDVKIYDRTLPEEIIARAEQADIVLTNKTVLSAETINKLPNLKYIGVLATGYNVVDTEAARERDIPVTNIPTYGTQSVAQFVFALLLELCHRVQRHGDSVHEGEWSQCPDFCYTKSPLVELDGKTMGIIGAGRIGLQTAHIARAFGMRVLAVDDGGKSGISDGVEWTDLTTLLKESDVISLHCPLLEDTRRIIRAERLALMKPNCFLINTSRGPLIDEADLAEALHKGTIGGAALDVLAVEPPTADNPLLHAPNCIITPHIAWATKEARSRLMDIAYDNVRGFLSGTSVNVVNR
ncbi:D-2-hydroxyacid dehydrogenase [Paenibacillus wynnii]|uniref:Glycerate dehydrogenase n=1 Tax=Paenibacillus wynnii TaxID=268407 RepID=A0A098MB68_9BACL|nr:D-2-hydroxyacid dehydrogenase [Paenibacillus wynnii]KGE18792.1 glycerate dehydrogenase [Paenibacillus wynnii]